MSVTAPQGFRAAGVAAGLKTTGAPDVAVVVNDGPLFAASAVFTSNRVQAAPVKFSATTLHEAHAAHKPIRAVVLNSGGANACTGQDGIEDSRRTAQVLTEQLDLDEGATLVCSTGLIGVRLPMSKIESGIRSAVSELAPTQAAGLAAAKAIMTTDTVHKVAVRSQNGVTVGGMAKGAGMLAPQLATMLVVLTTDAVLSHDAAQRILAEACRTTFNRVDSDACMSTNDTVILLANGASGIELEEEQVGELVREVCAVLARELVADAEGASHDVHVRVTKASSEEAAEAVAREITRSNLVKTALFGNDPNWGRIASSAGCVPHTIAPFDPDQMNIAVNGVWVAKNGAVGEDRDLVDMSAREVEIIVELNSGEAQADMWTNDLTHDYVEENSAYSS